jgi:kynurenine formamidase
MQSMGLPGRLVDLSVVVDTTTLGPPAAGSPPVVLETSRRGPGHWQSSRMAALLHTGSHVDSPLHVVADGATIGSVELDRVVGEAVVVDVHDVGEREAIDADRLERAGTEIHPGDIVAIRTDWTDRAWGSFPDYYVRSPYLTEDGARWIAEHRPKAAVVDFFEEECAISPEFTSEDFVAHRELLGRGIPIVEQAVGLGSVGRERFLLLAPFFRLEGVEAAPCRIFALLD